MTETTFHPSPAQQARCAATEVVNGTALRGVVHDPLARYCGATDAFPGNAGLFSTARDLARYARMILRDGELDGVRVLKPETVRRMVTPHSPPGLKPRALGWDVYTEPPWQPRPDAPPGRGAVGHTGYTGTLLWIDRGAGVFVALLTNRVHPDDSAKVEPLRKAVLAEVVSACQNFERAIEIAPHPH
jgi:CubicO group peptidase (beta-lactamase class C family)